MPQYARYTSRVDFRIGDSYKEMLKTLSEAAKRPESELLRNMVEKSILRRYKKLQKPAK